MISSLYGKLIQKGPDFVVVDVSGIGFKVFVPYSFSEQVRKGESVSLHTYLVVREDALTLYGFPQMDQVELFDLLLGVNGVGPRLALETLSTHSPQVINRAVVHKQDGIFSQVSGIGSKTAQKIILHLEDRIRLTEEMDRRPVLSDTNAEVQEALVALGYSVVEAQAALQSIPEDAPDDVEERLTIALRYFS
ncbi:MAG: Holliday junction branch migration protein RuvA [Anaerolineales bacterium]